MRTIMAITCAGAALVFAGEARAQAQVGDRVTCSMSAGASSVTGTVIKIEPRPGWDEPWLIVRVPSRSTHYDYRCVQSDLIPTVEAEAPPPRAPVAPARTAAPRLPAPEARPGANLCRPGAKVEGIWGNSWYEVTVLRGPDARGWCPVHFDGYDSFNDASVPELRPRGSGHIMRPVNPVSDTPAPRGAVPDGTYRCSKIEGGGGGYRYFGNATIRGGRVTSLALPTGWSVVSVTRGDPNAWSDTVADIVYRTTSGNTDKLECIPQ